MTFSREGGTKSNRTQLVTTLQGVVVQHCLNGLENAEESGAQIVEMIEKERRDGCGRCGCKNRIDNV